MIWGVFCMLFSFSCCILSFFFFFQWKIGFFSLLVLLKFSVYIFIFLVPHKSKDGLIYILHGVLTDVGVNFQIHFVLLISRQGKVRLTKWYSPYSQKERSKVGQLFASFSFIYFQAMRIFAKACWLSTHLQSLFALTRLSSPWIYCRTYPIMACACVCSCSLKRLSVSLVEWF